MLTARIRAALLPAAVLAIVAGAPAPAAAQQQAPKPADLARARTLFKEARALEDAGSWDAALTRLQEVARVKMTPQVRFHLALCTENVGLWTQALEGYVQAAREAKGTVAEVEAEANEHIRRLNEAIPTVVVKVRGAVPGDVVYLDRRPATIGDEQPIPLDPGPHEAELRRGSETIARELFRLEPAHRRRVELVVPAPAPIAETAPPAAPLPSLPSVSATAPPPPPIAPPPPSGMSAQRIAGLAVLGLGGASAILTGVFAGMRAAALEDLDMACKSHTGCPRTVEPIVARGQLDSALVNVFGALTLASAAGGTALLLTAPPAAADAPSAPRIAVAPSLGPGGPGLIIGGTIW